LLTWLAVSVGIHHSPTAAARDTSDRHQCAHRALPCVTSISRPL
jgi:hypothetical protein